MRLLRRRRLHQCQSLPVGGVHLGILQIVASGPCGEKDKPIFWYRPAKSDKYRVIYADLPVREMEEAPEVPGAEPIGVTPKPDQ